MNISRFWKARKREFQHMESPNLIGFLIILRKQTMCNGNVHGAHYTLIKLRPKAQSSKSWNTNLHPYYYQ